MPARRTMMLVGERRDFNMVVNSVNQVAGIGAGADNLCLSQL